MKRAGDTSTEDQRESFPLESQASRLPASVGRPFGQTLVRRLRSQNPSEGGDDLSRGLLIAEVLAMSWRNAPVPSSFSSESLERIAPLLLNSGGGALGWWALQESSLRSTPPAHALRQSYRLHTLEAALRERDICGVFSLLRSHGLDPLLGKGWAIARHYPEPGLRPYGDIDLYVRPDQYNAFVTALATPEAKGWNVDLHRGVPEFDECSFDDLYAHSQVVSIGAVEVRTFGYEDHLRLLCLHMLREGALRPLWLCDIAVALNSLALGFDWNYFLSGSRRRSDWTECAIGLAHQLLGAKVDELPVAKRAENLPRWLVPTVLKQWGTGKVTKGRRAPMSGHLRHPAGALSSLRLRWPNAIEATVGVKGPFNNWPRLPFQIGECVMRTAAFAMQFPKLLSTSR